MMPVGVIGVLQRDHYMEEAEAPKYRLFHRRHNETFTNRVGVDAERDSDQLRREQSRRESDWPGKCPPPRNCTRLVTLST